MLEDKIYVYNFGDLRLIDMIETNHNPNGPLCTISYGPICILAAPQKN